MKIVVNLKDPDCLIDAISDALENQLTNSDLGLDQDEIDSIKDIRTEKIKTICSKWFKYGEYVDLEIDTELETITVLEQD